MDAAKKAAREKQIVIGLVALFAVTFVMGPMKTLGWFKPRPGPASGMETVTISKPIGAVMEDFWKRVNPEVGPEARGSTVGSEAPAAYTAHKLRDPFKSLLPQASGGAEDLRADPPVSPAPPPPKRPAPELHVEGLVWGGPTPSAIIDGEVYRVGDALQDDTIIAITRRGVTLEHEGDRILYPPAAMVSGNTGNSPSARTQRWQVQRQWAQQQKAQPRR